MRGPGPGPGDASAPPTPAARFRRTRCPGSSWAPGGGPRRTVPTGGRPPCSSASRACPARDGPPRVAAAPRRGGRTRRRGSPARRACGTARCGGRSARATRRPAPPLRAGRCRPCRRRGQPRSGGDARADHGVGVERVVERHRLARRHRALRGVEAHAQAGVVVFQAARHGAPVGTDLCDRPGAGDERPLDPGERGLREQDRRARSASAAPPTVTRRDATSTRVT